jgi:tRNA (mo5U34)-methyltransferase
MLDCSRARNRSPFSTMPHPPATPLDDPYGSLTAGWPGNAWLERLAAAARDRLRTHGHGDLPRWRAALAALPAVTPAARLGGAMPRLGPRIDSGGGDARLREALMALHPWRKGPLGLGGVTIDSEWRSDWKWARIAPHVELGGERILDVGCGNGYYGWRMLGGGAHLVVGVDPTLVYVMQWLACRHFAGDLPNYVLPLGLEDLPEGKPGFDTVLSMGVLYHRRDPDRHLRRLRQLVRPGGRLLLETLVLPEERAGTVLQPENRYARMRNVWAVPGSDRLLKWVREAGWRDVALLDRSPTTTDEQRSTRWMRFESLAQALDPDDPQRTVEGHPAPIRAVLTASR